MVDRSLHISANSLAVAVLRGDREGFEQREFPNSAAGHQQLIGWLLRQGERVRVCLESTGIYSLDVALALDGAEAIVVAVLNPKRVLQFARTLGRSKTDKADAQALAVFCRTMEFEPWRRPSDTALALRSLSRLIATLVEDRTRVGNRLHAAKGSAATPRCVLQELKRMWDACEKRIVRMRRRAVDLVRQDADLERKFRQMTTVPGIGEVSAVTLLGELAGLDPEMSVRQLVAHAGLDPVPQVSGTSVRKPSRISRQGNAYLRRGLFMPALGAARFDPHMKAFYQQLQLRQKAKMQAVIAVERKILHAIFGIFKTDTPYNGAKLFPQIQLS